MTTIDMKLAAKGQRAPRIGLLDQGRYHIELETRYRGALQAAGFRLEDIGEVIRTVALLDTQHAEALEARADSKADSRREQSAIDEAKACKRKLVLAFSDLAADGLVTPEDFDIVRKSGDLRRSAPRISAYLADIRNPVKKYGDVLKGYFNGVSAISIVDAVKAELDSAQSKQETNLATLPEETLKIYELKGSLLSLIEKMNRCGKIAFDGEAHIIGQFNKDLLRRARARRRTQSGIEPAAEIGVKAAIGDNEASD